MKWILAGDGMTKEFALSVRLYAACELTTLLKRAGFREARAFGDVSGVPYDDKAKRLVVVALR
jgi:hypothetical protein